MEILAAIIFHWDMLLVPAASIYLGAWLAFLFWKQRRNRLRDSYKSDPHRISK